MKRAEHWAYNNLGSGTGKEARQKVVSDTLPTTYYFVYEHLAAIRSWKDLVQDPKYRASESFGGKVPLVTTFTSRHNSAYRYMGDCINGGIETLPENERYRRLFLTTDAGYAGLDRKTLRYVFTGEQALVGQDPERIITLEEIQGWMITHSSNPDGLIQNVSANGIQNQTALTEINSGSNLVRYFRLNKVDDRDSAWVDKAGQVLFDRFPAEVHRLAVQKLACGLAVIDQVVHESANVGLVVAPDYRPHEYQPDTGEKLPSLEQLWGESFHLVETLTDPHNVLLGGLFRNSL